MKDKQKSEKLNNKKKYIKPTVTDLDDAFAMIEPMSQSTCSTVGR